MSNIISNSLKYRSNQDPKIEVSASKEDDYFHFKISDNGIGFEPENSERIFKMFQRLHGNNIPGTGIGLALCKRIISKAGGRIWAESKPNIGTTIHFTLPV